MTVTNVQILDHPDDKPADRLLCAEIGRTLSEFLPGWTWMVEIQPAQGVVTIRNLDLVEAGTNKPYCMVKKLTNIEMPRLTHDIVAAGREMLERYERYRRHHGKFAPEDLGGHRFISPET